MICFTSFLCYLIILFLLLNFLFPKKLWRLLESWKARHEPSPVFFLLRRVCSLFLLVLLLIMLYKIRTVAK